MKKAQETSSLNFLIGLILALLMIGGVGCVAYGYYESVRKSEKSFNDFSKFLLDLEKKDKDASGEFLYYIDNNKFLIGFPKDADVVSNGWGRNCYGIPFGLGVFYAGNQDDINLDTALISLPSTILGTLILGPGGVVIGQMAPRMFMAHDSAFIKKPEILCEKGKACLCLCAFSTIAGTTTKYVAWDACSVTTNAKCKPFEKLDFIGGDGCSHVAFIPGLIRKGSDYDRGYKSLYYNKAGNVVSIDDEKALTMDSLKNDNRPFNLSEEDMSKIMNNITVRFDDYFKNNYPDYEGAGKCVVQFSIDHPGMYASLVSSIMIYEKWEFKDKNDCGFLDNFYNKVSNEPKDNTKDNKYFNMIISGKTTDEILDSLYDNGYSKDGNWVSGVKTIYDDIIKNTAGASQTSK